MATKKKAANGSGSIRKRADGRWEGSYVAGYDGGTGKMIRRSVYGRTQKEVRQKLTEVTRSLDTGTYQAPNRITVAQWLDEWLEVFCAHAVKPLTLTSYQIIAKNHIKPRIGAIQLQELRGTHIQKIYNDMISGGASPKTAKNAAAVLHKSLSIAQKQGLIHQNPCDIAESQRHRNRKLSRLQMQRYRTSCPPVLVILWATPLSSVCWLG